MSSAYHPFGISWTGTIFRFRPRLVAGRDDTIDRQVEFHAAGKGVLFNAFGEVQHVVFDQ